MKQHIEQGETYEVRIVKTGRSGDYIGYPIDAVGDVDGKADGIHLDDGRLSGVYTVRVVSVDEGFPEGEILRNEDRVQNSGDTYRDYAQSVRSKVPLNGI